jgi:hypothetical protein
MRKTSNKGVMGTDTTERCNAHLQLQSCTIALTQHLLSFSCDFHHHLSFSCDFHLAFLQSIIFSPQLYLIIFCFCFIELFLNFPLKSLVTALPHYYRCQTLI